jgi:rSAM/selenodomain-associated transferase 2/rSAM/selenodomain-associated transferase 1
MKYSVIIPVWNEEHNIIDCVDSIRKLNPDAEIIVSDGHSTDATLTIASLSGARTCLSRRGRGPQCNAGAAIARGDILVFLHVDTRLPDHAFTLLEEAFSDLKTQFGVFRLTFDVRHWFLDMLPLLVRPDLPFFRFGDQCFIIRRSFFLFLGGFPNLSLYEDVALARKASRYTRIHIFPDAVTTSARRFIRNGAVRQFFHDGVSLFRYLTGADPKKLAGNYDNTNGRTSTALIAMARKPEPGKVKTRLARTVGAVTAAQVYRICAKIAFREMKKVRGSVNRYVFLAGDDRGGIGGHLNLLSPSFYYMSQRGKDLGERLDHAFRTVFRHGVNQVIVMATDVPDISSEIMERAADCLDRHDIVLGPSPDGGYYLIGMDRFHEEFFLDIDWGTSRVLAQTLTIARRLGLSIGLLPELADIDNYNDLSRWIAMGKVRHPLFRLLWHKLPPAGKSSVSDTLRRPRVGVLKIK